MRFCQWKEIRSWACVPPANNIDTVCTCKKRKEGRRNLSLFEHLTTEERKKLNAVLSEYWQLQQQQSVKRETRPFEISISFLVFSRTLSLITAATAAVRHIRMETFSMYTRDVSDLCVCAEWIWTALTKKERKEFGHFILLRIDVVVEYGRV